MKGYFSTNGGVYALFDTIKKSGSVLARKLAVSFIKGGASGGISA
jgi:hypothetical protein